MTPTQPRPTPAEMYEQFFVPAMFRPLAERVLAAAAPYPGERVLDLACGTGIVARLAAPRVGPGGRVVALDLRPGMLAAARALPPPDGAAIEWVQGDAVAPDLPDGAFDLVACQQGLQFFADRAAAVRAMRRLLAPGGRAVAACWKSLDRQGVFAAMAEVERRHLEPLGVGADEFEQPFSLGDPDALRALFEGAGFTDVTVTAHAIDVRFAGADDFVRKVEYAYAAVVPTFAEDPARFDGFVEAVERECADLFRRHRDGDALVFGMHTEIVTAR